MRTPALIALAITALLGACTTPPRLQTLGEVLNEINRGNQDNMEAQCGNAGQRSVDCRRKVREEFARQRKKNDPAARN